MFGCRYRWCGILLGAGGAVSAACAGAVTVEAARDNTLFDTGGATSSGAGPSIFSGRTGAGAGGLRQRAVLAFDVAAAVPAGATITGVTLQLTLVGAGGPGGVEHELGLHRVSDDWGEGSSASDGGSGAPATAGDATWTHRFHPDVPWSVPGGVFGATPSATALVGTEPGEYGWGSTAAMVADVQGWLDEPAAAHGWLILGNESVLSTARKFASREAADVAARPRLAVVFSPPASCVGDLDADGEVGFGDLRSLLAAFGACPGCPADLDEDGVVGVSDVAQILGAWGGCP